MIYFVRWKAVLQDSWCHNKGSFKWSFSANNTQKPSIALVCQTSLIIKDDYIHNLWYFPSGLISQVVSQRGGLISQVVSHRGGLISQVVSRRGGLISQVVSCRSGLISQVVSHRSGLISQVVSRRGGLISQVVSRRGGLISQVVSRRGGLINQGPQGDIYVLGGWINLLILHKSLVGAEVEQFSNVFTDCAVITRTVR